MFNTSNNTGHTYDITDVGYIERIVVGSTTPEHIPTNEENQEKIQMINRCLTDFPKGRIIGMERSFTIVRVGEHQVVLESIVYHLGFKKVPLWLQESKKKKPDFNVDPKKVEAIISQSNSKT